MIINTTTASTRPPPVDGLALRLLFQGGDQGAKLSCLVNVLGHACTRPEHPRTVLSFSRYQLSHSHRHG
jgi:hypothetical protein